MFHLFDPEITTVNSKADPSIIHIAQNYFHRYDPQVPGKAKPQPSGLPILLPHELVDSLWTAGPTQDMCWGNLIG